MRWIGEFICIGFIDYSRVDSEVQLRLRVYSYMCENRFIDCCRVESGVD